MEAFLEKLRSGSALDWAALGKSARLDAMLWALKRSRRAGHCSALSDVVNPSLREKGIVRRGLSNDKNDVIRFVADVKPDFAIIGPEEPLEAGAVNWLRDLGVPCVGPTQTLAKLESSKAFTRQLLTKRGISGNPEHRIFQSTDGLAHYLRDLGEYVIKPDILTGGKGVKVSGDHLPTLADGFAYAEELLNSGTIVLVEEKLYGEEFSLQSFCDGKTLKHMPPVQDHKRAWEDDRGPNTGGMGSYSCEDHRLPFLSSVELETARHINEQVAEALLKETNEEYKGIIYGSFMATAEGLKVIEYNARFGDPECMNVLSIMETDFIDICIAILTGTLDQISLHFAPKATVCKYVVPEGYPNSRVGNAEILLPRSVTESGRLRIFYGAVDDEEDGKLRMTGSRAIAFVGIGDTLNEAEQVAEWAVSQVGGPVSHRRDIGKDTLVRSRVAHMDTLRGKLLPDLRRA
jgi:phosphoribosylamine--glycine ligase